MKVNVIIEDIADPEYLALVAANLPCNRSIMFPANTSLSVLKTVISKLKEGRTLVLSPQIPLEYAVAITRMLPNGVNLGMSALLPDALAIAVAAALPTQRTLILDGATAPAKAMAIASIMTVGSELQSQATTPVNTLCAIAGAIPKNMVFALACIDADTLVKTIKALRPGSTITFPGNITLDVAQAMAHVLPPACTLLLPVDMSPQVIAAMRAICESRSLPQSAPVAPLAVNHEAAASSTSAPPPRPNLSAQPTGFRPPGYNISSQMPMSYGSFAYPSPYEQHPLNGPFSLPVAHMFRPLSRSLLAGTGTAPPQMSQLPGHNSAQTMSSALINYGRFHQPIAPARLPVQPEAIDDDEVEQAEEVAEQQAKKQCRR